MKIAIFSDLHLSSHQFPDHENLFVQTLKKLRNDNCQELWLLGDVFDLMVGPFEFWKELHPQFFEEIELWIKESRSVLWLQGNHDFFLEDLLGKMGVDVHDDDVVKSIHNKKYYLSHGDRINQEDLAYLKWRRLTRSSRFRLGLHLLPKSLQKRLIPYIGQKLSDKSRSRSHQGQKSAHTTALYQEFATQKWSEGYDGVCIGHSHQEDLIQNEQLKFYLNLGSWINYSPRYALWETLSENSPRIVKI